MNNNHNKIIIGLFYIFLLVIILMVKISDFRLQKINNEIEKASKEVKLKYLSNKSDLIVYPNRKKPKGNSKIEKVINIGFDPYFYISNARLMDADINQLQKINKDTVGWIQIKGTDISYPFVQYKDNEYYSKYSYYGTKTSVGWIFMDYRNSRDFSDKNTVLYTKKSIDYTRFQTLKTLIFSSLKDKNKLHMIKISTKDNDTLWQVVSAFPYENEKITDDNILEIKNFNKFKKKILEKSLTDYRANIEDDDKILTLSIKYSDAHTVLIYAKLVKKIEKGNIK